MIPVEIWILILTYRDESKTFFLRECQRDFLSFSLVCKSWHRILSDPCVRTQWILSICDGNIHNSALLAISFCWIQVLEKLCMRHSGSIRLNDALIALMCRLRPSQIHLELVIKLVHYGADPRFMENFALRRAARAGSAPLVTFLLSKGASATDKNFDALRLSTLARSLECVQILIHHGSDSFVALQAASVSGYLEAVSWICEGGESEDDAQGDSGWQDRLKSHCVAIGDELAEFLSDVRGLDTRAAVHHSIFTKHPLVLAATNNQLSALAIVISYMKRCYGQQSRSLEFLEAFDKHMPDGMRALLNLSCQNASMHGFEDVIRLLLKNGSDVGLAVYTAAKYNQTAIVRLCLREFSSELYVPVVKEVSEIWDPFESTRMCEAIDASDNSAIMENPIFCALRASSDREIIEMLMEFSNLNWRQMVEVILMDSNGCVLSSLSSLSSHDSPPTSLTSMNDSRFSPSPSFHLSPPPPFRPLTTQRSIHASTGLNTDLIVNSDSSSAPLGGNQHRVPIEQQSEWVIVDGTSIPPLSVFPLDHSVNRLLGR